MGEEYEDGGERASKPSKKENVDWVGGLSKQSGMEFRTLMAFRTIKRSAAGIEGCSTLLLLGAGAKGTETIDDAG